jgi:hypothetical protein
MLHHKTHDNTRVVNEHIVVWSGASWVRLFYPAVYQGLASVYASTQLFGWYLVSMDAKPNSGAFFVL